MSKHIFTSSRRLPAAMIVALVGASPVLAKTPSLPTAPAAQAETAGPQTPIKNQATLAMNVALTCVRSGTRMIC